MGAVPLLKPQAAHVPRLRLTPRECAALTENPVAAAALALPVAQCLRQRPYFVVLSGLPVTERSDIAKSLAQAIARLPSARQAHRAPDRVSFTKVRIAKDKTLNHEQVTRYSRTHLSLDLHTDSSYKPNPHELVLFQMIRPDPAGGDTLLASVEDVCAALPPEARQTLAQPIYPFGRGALPVLWASAGRPRIRYYRSQIEAAVKQGAGLEAAAGSAMAALDSVLQAPDHHVTVRLAAGEIVCLNNIQALHGRTGFAPDSDRLMYRVRAHAGCLL